MPILAFNKATDPNTPDDVRINTAAVRFVEAARPGQPSLTVIHVLGEKDAGIPVMEAPDLVATSIGGLVAAKRYFGAGQADDGKSAVFVAAANVSQLRPNNPSKRDFWAVLFTDGSELRIADPLPGGL